MVRAWLGRSIGFVRFVGAGAASFALILLLVTLLPQLGFSPTAAYAAALAAAFLFNFVSNRFFVFGAGQGKLGQQAVAYLVASLAFRGCEWLTFVALSSLTHLPSPLLAFLIQGVSTCVKYLVYKRQVFRAA